MKVQRVADGVELEILAEDAMNKRQRLHITIPLYGAVPDNRDVQVALDEMSRGRPMTLERAAQYLAQRHPAGDGPPLSNDEFLAAASRAVRSAEELLEQVPAELRERVRHGLDVAFYAGRIMETVAMREQHLPDVTREAGMKTARKKGGEAREGKTLADTDELVRFMAGLIAAGKKVGMAAELALKRKPRDGGPLGTSKRANVERFRYWSAKHEAAKTDRHHS